jgi:nitrate reductase delta subunit
MKMTLRALAALIAYPSAELRENMSAVRGALSDEKVLPERALKVLEPLLAGLEQDDLLDLQSAYSELFDRSRRLSLHLFEHVHGDSRERGQAMIDLGQQYARDGFLLDTSELPDFIPVFLEYASCLAPERAREMLTEPAHVFAALAERLDKRNTTYAAIFHALLAIAAVRPEAEALAELDKRAPEEDPAKIDEEWQEAPVTFLASAAHEMGGPTGMAAKIRASKRAATREETGR